jgi:ATP-dependent RNA helicase DeaD
MLQGDVPLLLQEDRTKPQKSPSGERSKQRPGERLAEKQLDPTALPLKDFPDIEMQRFRIEVGYEHGVKPGNIVGAIANEAELESRYIGHIEIFDDFSTVDLPAGMPRETFNTLKKVWVCQRQLRISRLGDSNESRPHKSDKPKRKRKGAAARKRK